MSADSDEKVAERLLAAGFPVQPCGLNANWNSRAWKLDAERVLLDAEMETDGTSLYSVVTYSDNEVVPLSSELPLELALVEAAHDAAWTEVLASGTQRDWADYLLNRIPAYLRLAVVADALKHIKRKGEG